MEGGGTLDIPLKRCALCRTQTFCWEGSDCLVEGENTMAGSRFESVFYKNRNYSVMYMHQKIMFRANVNRDISIALCFFFSPLHI